MPDAATTSRDKLVSRKQPHPRPRTPTLNVKESGKLRDDERERAALPQGLGVRKKGLGNRSWLRFDRDGNTSTFESDKYGIMKRVLIPARDLRILDPLLSYPSTILGRERAIVVNLEDIKAIITAEEVLLLNSEKDSVGPFIEELRKRLPVHFNSLGQQVAGDGGGGLSDNEEAHSQRSGGVSPDMRRDSERAMLSAPPSPRRGTRTGGSAERSRSPLGQPRTHETTVISSKPAAAPMHGAEGRRSAVNGILNWKATASGATTAPGTPDRGIRRSAVMGEDGLLGMRSGGPNALPFEFRALEVCLEAACRNLDDETTSLEKEAYPALDELTSRISTLNLERVRIIKSSLVTISGRVQKVRDEIERLLDDDGDMAEMYLTDKLEKELAAVEETRAMLSPIVRSAAHTPTAFASPHASPQARMIPRAGRPSIMAMDGDPTSFIPRAGRPSIMLTDGNSMLPVPTRAGRPSFMFTGADPLLSIAQAGRPSLMSDDDEPSEQNEINEEPRHRSFALEMHRGSPLLSHLATLSDEDEEEEEEAEEEQEKLEKGSEAKEAENGNGDRGGDGNSGSDSGRSRGGHKTSTSSSSSSSSSSGNTSRAGAEVLDVEELEMLLEAYFVQIDGSLNKILTLREYVDDTEDFINIMLDDKQNHLLQMGVLVTTATLVISMYVVVVGFFGMNVPMYLFNPKYKNTFYWIIGGSTGGSIILCAIVIAYCRWKRLIEF